MKTIVKLGVASLALIVLGCSPEPPPSPRVQKIDLGTHAVDEGGVLLEATATIMNDSNRVWYVTSVVPTCGCVRADLSSDVIRPGDEATLEIGMKLLGTGVQQQQVNVFYSDGGIDTIVLVGIGKREYAFESIPERVVLNESTRFARIRVSRTRMSSDPIDDPPVVVSPDVIHIRFGGWRTLEMRDPENFRPTRQIATIDLDLRNYEGPLPVDVVLRDADGGELLVTVLED